MTTFGQRFKQLRLDKKKTQKELADNFFLNYTSISKYENDKAIPEHTLLANIADYFNVSLDYLLGRTDDPNSEIVAFKDGENLFEVELEKGTKEKLTEGQLQALIKKLEAVNFDIEKLIEKVKEEEYK